MKNRKFYKKWALLPAIVVLLALAVSSWVFLNSEKPQDKQDSSHKTQVSRKPATSSQPEQPDTIRLIATGDMLPHDTVNQAARTGSGYNYLPLFDRVAPFLKDADLSFCNQESPSAGQFSVTGYPTFNAPPAFAKNLSALGCNVINLANNHTNDRGQAGINGTLQVWSTLPTLAVAGAAQSQAEQNEVATFTKAGMTFALLSYTKCSNSSLSTSYGVNLLSKSRVTSQIAQARAAGVDMIIAGVHWCNENTSQQNSDQEMWAQYFADKGVDIVIGTGPHWLQPVKKLNKAGGGTTLVWFSLGNFLSTQLEVNGLIGGIAVMEISTKTHSVEKVGFLPTYMHYEWTTAEKARGDLLARHNLMLYPLDQASSALAKSQNDTSVSAQTTRVKELLNRYTDVTILTSKDFASFGD